jgi:hypothetical protein
MITITFTMMQWISVIFLMISLGSQLFAAYCAHKRAKVLKVWDAALDEREKAIFNLEPDQMAARVTSLVTVQISDGAEMLERALGDIDYLHDLLYKDTPHPADCPTCHTTRSELEKLIAALKSAKVAVEGRREGRGE